ncbi:hypothetical protein LdCL_130005600 [Leishmania donovani]|uniref:Uncharacterized protein n=1 Tax=Leishmania donovani TaxID=5661 RepID=A0A3S5H6M8_LEIDO|nr:hypothetical protein LdCL_130005600 [Leishmania donovani]
MSCHDVTLLRLSSRAISPFTATAAQVAFTTPQSPRARLSVTPSPTYLEGSAHFHALRYFSHTRMTSPPSPPPSAFLLSFPPPPTHAQTHALIRSFMSHLCAQGASPSFPTLGAATTAVTSDVVCELSPVQSGRPHEAVVRVEDRLLRYGAVYQERLREAQRHKRTSEAAALESIVRPPSPELQRRLFVPTPSLHASAEAARQHRGERQSALLAERATAYTCQPAILPVSREMAASERRRNGWMQLPVGDVLMERHKRAEGHLEEKRQKEVARFSFRATISARARTMKSSRPVVERLYSGSGDSGTDTATFADVTNLRSSRGEKTKTASMATYQRLYEDAVTRRAQDQTHEKLARVRSRNEFCPRTDSVSGLIASKRGDTTHQRLLRPRAALDVARDVCPEETFAPRINTSTRFEQAPLSARAAMWQRRRSERLHHAVVARCEAEMRECTFHPRTLRGLTALSQAHARETADSCTSPLASIVSSAEELLRRVDLEASAPLPESGRCAPLLYGDGKPPGTVPADILAVLEEAEQVSEALRLLPDTNLDLDLSLHTSTG